MKRPLALICLIFSIFLALSADFSSLDEYNTTYNDSIGQSVVIDGIVDDIAYRDLNGTSSMTIYLKEGILCYMKDNSYTPKIGAKVTIRGTKKLFNDATNPGEFNLRIFYETTGLHYSLNNSVILSEGLRYSKFKNTLFHIRRYFSSIFDSSLPPNEASIMKTMLLGEKSELSKDIKSLYQRNGIAHILSISGLHISLIGSIILLFLKKTGLGVRISSAISSLFVLSYGIMTGFSVSSLRAIFMFSLSMLATIVGRTYDLLTAVSLAAFLILLENPLYANYSGFIFSFVSIVGIAIFIPTMSSDDLSFISSHNISYNSSRISSLDTPPNTSYRTSPLSPFLMSHRMSFFSKTLLKTIAFSIIGLPIYYWYYYQIPIYSVFLNLLIIPTLGILVLGGLLLLLAVPVSEPLSYPLRWIIVGLLKLFEALGGFTDKLPGHYYTPGAPSKVQLIIYSLILIAIVLLKKHLPLSVKWLIALSAVVFLSIRIRPATEISFLDVGQGDSIFIRESQRIGIPGLMREQTILVDGGSTTKKDVGTYIIIPFLKERGASKIDAIILTHPDEDHTNGLIELITKGSSEGITIKSAVLPKIDTASKSENYLELENIIRDSDIELRYMSKGDHIKLCKLNMVCLSPENNMHIGDENEGSIALLGQKDSFSFLLTGDIQGSAEDKMITTLKDQGTNNITLLKVSHHGSKNSTPSELLSIINPDVSIISVGKDNRYGHPHKETLDRLAKYAPNSQILRTDEHGAITISEKRGRLVCTLYKKEISY